MGRRHIKDPELRALRKIVDLLPLLSRASRNWLTDKMQDRTPKSSPAPTTAPTLRPDQDSR